MGTLRNKAKFQFNEDRYLKHIPYGCLRVGGGYINVINKRKARESGKQDISIQLYDE